MFSLRRPSADELADWLSVRAAAPAFTNDPVIPETPPRGFRRIHCQTQLGVGESVYHRVCAAQLEWESFPHTWATVEPRDLPVETGRTVAVVVRSLGIWTVNACRVVDVSECDAGSVRRFGFTYSTCGDHVMRGAERFEVAWDCGNDVVSYIVASYSRPRHPLVQLAAPFVRSQQLRFVHDSQAAFKQASVGWDKLAPRAPAHR